jgi:predicted membrane protein
MSTVDLSDAEWQVVINWIGTKVVWAECNGMLMKIGQQLQRQQVQGTGSPITSKQTNADGKEVGHE